MTNLEITPDDPVVEALNTEEVTEDENYYIASQWTLMWWRFRKHRMAMLSLFVIILLYAIALFAEFVAPYDPEAFSRLSDFVPPQQVRFFHDGQFIGPFVYELVRERDLETARVTYVENIDVVHKIQFFVRGYSYKWLGIIETDRHLFGLSPDTDESFFLFGADRLGRDMFSRLVYGARISLSVGLIGVFFSFIFGIIMGGISGYYGGAIDNLIQRLIEFLRSIPTIPLWMGLAAALPVEWPPLRVYFLITIILSAIGWTGLARVVRGRFLSMRNEDFILAARFAGASERRIIFRHMLPSFTSHIIASLTLAIPDMILGETALSFLGLGLRPPVVSWGVLLKEAQNLRTIALAPWLLMPGIAIVITILAFNFLGDGLRDAADPYSR